MLSVMKLVFLEKVTKTLLLSNFLSNLLEKNLMPKLQELSVFKMHFILKSKILIKLKRQNWSPIFSQLIQLKELKLIS